MDRVPALTKMDARPRVRRMFRRAAFYFRPAFSHFSPAPFDAGTIPHPARPLHRRFDVFNGPAGSHFFARGGNALPRRPIVPGLLAAASARDFIRCARGISFFGGHAGKHRQSMGILKIAAEPLSTKNELRRTARGRCNQLDYSCFARSRGCSI